MIQRAYSCFPLSPCQNHRARRQREVGQQPHALLPWLKGDCQVQFPFDEAFEKCKYACVEGILLHWLQASIAGKNAVNLIPALCMSCRSAHKPSCNTSVCSPTATHLILVAAAPTDSAETNTPSPRLLLSHQTDDAAVPQPV